MPATLLMALVAFSSSICYGADLPRSSPEAQGVSSSAILAFVEAADKNIDAMNSLHAPASRSRRGGRLVGAVQRRVAPLLVLAEQELRIHGRGAGNFREETQPGRRGAEVLSRRCPVRPEQQPEVDAGQRPAPHVHGASKRAAALARSALDQDLPAQPVPFKPGTHFLYNTSGTYMLSAIVQKATGMTVLDYLRPRCSSLWASGTQPGKPARKASRPAVSV